MSRWGQRSEAIGVGLDHRWLVVAAVVSGLGLALVAIGLGGGMRDSGSAAGQWAGAIRIGVLAQTGWLCLAIPSIGLRAMAAERNEARLRARFLSQRPLLEFVVALAPSYSASLLLVLASGLPLLALSALFYGPLLAWVALAQLQLCLLAVALLLLGSLLSALLMNLSSAAGICYLLVVLAVLAPVLCGPFIDQVSRNSIWVDAALFVSPLVAVASTIRYDVMRTEVLYRWSPIPKRGLFRYPSLRGTSTAYACLALFLLGSLLLVDSLELRGLLRNRRDQ